MGNTTENKAPKKTAAAKGQTPAEKKKKAVAGRAKSAPVKKPKPTKTSKESDLLVRFSVSKSNKDIQSEIDKLADEYTHSAKLPGFRKGKVPVEIVKKTYLQSLTEEVLNQAVNDLTLEKIKRDKLAVVSKPVVEKLDFGEGKDMVADIVVEILPNIALPDFAKLEIQVSKKELAFDVYDEKKLIDEILEANLQTIPVKDRGIKENDLTVIKVQSRDLKTKRFTPKKSEYVRMKKEEPSEILDLYQELLEKKAADKLVIQREYPKDYFKKGWAGKSFEHHLQIEFIYEFSKPELDQAFLERLGVKTEKELKERMKEEYERRMQQNRDSVFFNQLVKTINDTSSFQVPFSLVQSEISRVMSQNQNPPTFKDDTERNAYLEKLKSDAEKSVRFSLIIGAVQRENKLDVSSKEVDAEFKKVADANNISLAEVRKYYSDKEKMDGMKDNLLQTKTIDFIKEKVTFKEV